MTIKNNLQKIKNSLPKKVTLVAVSKTKPNEDLMEAYKAGQRIFGENKVQEIVNKYPQMPLDTKWHMIGHLQRNKVKYLASFIDLIHGIDSLKLLKEINKQAIKHDRTIKGLIQINISNEITKFGMTADEAREMFCSKEFKSLNNVNIIGVMGMASFTTNKSQIRKEFLNLKLIFDSYKEFNPTMEVISMGMSGDYNLAIECGSNMIRIGSSIFGSR